MLTLTFRLLPERDWWLALDSHHRDVAEDHEDVTLPALPYKEQYLPYYIG
jgi:hypothetical protein